MRSLADAALMAMPFDIMFIAYFNATAQCQSDLRLS
jgi:hypothetical protein